MPQLIAQICLRLQLSGFEPNAQANRSCLFFQVVSQQCEQQCGLSGLETNAQANRSHWFFRVVSQLCAQQYAPQYAQQYAQQYVQQYAQQHAHTHSCCVQTVVCESSGSEAETSTPLITIRTGHNSSALHYSDRPWGVPWAI